jgi:hypothetical protein
MVCSRPRRRPQSVLTAVIVKNCCNSVLVVRDPAWNRTLQGEQLPTKFLSGEPLEEDDEQAGGRTIMNCR